MNKADILAIDPSDEMSAVLDSCVGSIPLGASHFCKLVVGASRSLLDP